MILPRPAPWLRLLCGAFLLGLCSLSAQEPAAPRPPSPAVRPVLDVPYVTGGHERQRLDLYLPGETSGAAGTDHQPRPLVVWVHGGGWEGGSKAGCPARVLVGRGYVVASIGYRLSTQAVYPAQIEDCKAAIRFLRAHAAEYGIDPERIGAWGESAGGHLVALLGTTGNAHRYDVGENLGESSRVQCVLDWYGPTDFLHWGGVSAETVLGAANPALAQAVLAAFLDRPDTALARLLGGTVTTHLDLARAASPFYDVDKDSAPFLIMHGDADSTVPPQQSEELHAALQKAGVESTLVMLPGAKHGGPAFTRPENLRLMADFLDRHLHPAIPAATP